VVVRADVDPCVEKLRQVADLTRYNTTYAAADYNAVRAALGYEKMALIGGSYGTRLTQEIIRRYPEHVDAAVLFGVAPPSSMAGSVTLVMR
jgi:pimeloyl-ACP methyl ester carboxylesterase